MSRIPFDPEAIRALASILRDTGLTEIELAEDNNRIRLVRAPAPAMIAAPVAVAAQAAAPTPAPAAAPVDDAHHPGTIPSPMVGVAYLSAEPGAPPFVQPGQTVTAGQTVLLIEAMKTFNQIKAPRAGTVLRVLVSSGEPVEYAQPLMVIE